MTVTFSPETEAWIAERKRKDDDPEIKAWLDERKREGLLIDPATAEVDWSFGQTIERVRTGPSTPKVEPAWQPRDPPYDIAKVMGMIREEFNRAGDDFPFLLRPY